MVKDEALRLGTQHRSTLFPWYLNVVQEWTGNGLPLNAHSGHGTFQNRSPSMCDTAQAWRLSVRGPCFLMAEEMGHTWFSLEGPGSGEGAGVIVSWSCTQCLFRLSARIFLTQFFTCLVPSNHQQRRESDLHLSSQPTVTAMWIAASQTSQDPGTGWAAMADTRTTSG